MALLKKLILAFFVYAALIAPTALADKIDNATPEEVVQAIKDTIRLSEDVVTAIQNRDELNSVLILFQKAKRFSKRIESNPVDRLRQKANSRMKKSRSAFKKGNFEEAEKYAVEGADIFKEVQTKYHSF